MADGGGLGISFLIGATLTSAVASAFSTVEARLNRTRQAMGAANREAREFGRAMEMQRRMQELRAQASGRGPEADRARAELARLEQQYARLSESVRRYGGDIDGMRRRQEAATAAAERERQRLAAYQNIQAQSQRRAQLVGQAMATVGTAMVAAAPLKAAIQFESAMADVAKTVDGARDGNDQLTEKYYEIQKSVLDLGRTIPLTHEEIASLYAAAGQQGIQGADNMREFTLMAAHMGVAFGMSTQEAADAIGGYQAALGLGMAETRDLLDLMNEFANTSSTTEKDVAEVVARVGSLAKVGGVSAKSLTALGATLTSMKIAPEVAATGIQNLILGLTAGDAATKSQQAAFAKLRDEMGRPIDAKALARHMQKDSEGAILSVLKSVKNLKEDERLSVLQQIFGKESLKSIAPFLDQLDLTISNLEKASKPDEWRGAMKKEFDNRAKTTANSLTLFKNSLNELAVGVGAVFLPAFNTALTAVTGWTHKAAEFVAKNKPLVTIVGAVAGGLLALSAASIAVQFGFSMLSTGLSGARLAILGVRTGMIAFNAALWANPVLLVAAGVAALGVAIYALYQKFEPVRAAVDALWAAIRPAAQIIGAVLITPLLAVPGIWRATVTALTGVWTEFSAWASGIWQDIGNGVAAGINWIMGIVSPVAEFFSSVFGQIGAAAEAVFPGIGSTISGIFDAIRGVAESFFTWLTSKFEWVNASVQAVAGAWGKARSLFGIGDDEAKDGEKKEEGGFFSRLGAALGFGGDEEEKKPELVGPPRPPDADAAVKPTLDATAQNAAATAAAAAPAEGTSRVETEGETPSAAANAPAASPQQTAAAVRPAAVDLARPVMGDAAQSKVETTTARNVADLAKPVLTEAVKAQPQKAAPALEPRIAQEAARAERAAAPKAAPSAQPGAQKAAPATAPAAPQVNFTLQAELKGIPDQAFSDGVVNAIKSRKSDLENILNEIVNNQVRLAYGGTAQS